LFKGIDVAVVSQDIVGMLWMLFVSKVTCGLMAGVLLGFVMDVCFWVM